MRHRLNRRPLQLRRLPHEPTCADRILLRRSDMKPTQGSCGSKATRTSPMITTREARRSPLYSGADVVQELIRLRRYIGIFPIATCEAQELDGLVTISLLGQNLAEPQRRER